MAPIELTAPPEQAPSSTSSGSTARSPSLTSGSTSRYTLLKLLVSAPAPPVQWNVYDVGLRGLTSKRQMKIMLRWMREKQKLRLICDHVGPHKQFLYTTWFTNPRNAPQRTNRDLPKP
uniref:Uncharacterized protein n=1 Tax=Avena sativa TaxID=4498 RepID=A0ACD5X5W3_AVESA